jgi:dTDP-4-dehydrorhamnose 3,5-epimerase
MQSTDPLSLVSLKAHSDDRGLLVAIEGTRDVPFNIDRVYFIKSGNGLPRGFHAHKALQQLMICVQGSCRIVLDDGAVRSEFVLNRPDQGLFVDRLTWREMHDFSPDAVLLVIASERFDEEDYIRDYDDFLQAASNGNEHAR